ncbi:MAG: hypothetical protein ACM3S0_08560 [Acidobacteriota bacterium]
MPESSEVHVEGAFSHLVEGLWARLRNVLIAIDRLDRLETATDFAGWVEGFQQDEAQIQATARDWVLRAVRLGSDPLNYRILQVLQDPAGVSIAQLMQATNLTRVDLTERIKDLAQVGFVAQALDMDSVQGTRAAEGMIAWIESLQARIAERARAGLTKDNPPPKAHRPASNL